MNFLKNLQKGIRMADVNINQTYRINIETNKDAKNAIDNIKALKEELKGIDTTLDKLSTDPISKLSKALDTLSKIDVGKISGNIKKLKDLDFSGLKKMTDTMKGLDASPLQRLTSALKGFSKINSDVVNSSINSVRNIDFSPLNEVSESLESVDSSPLSKLLNVLNRVGKIDLNNLGVINDNLAKVGNVNVSGLAKLNEQIKELDVTKLYMLSAAMVNFARSGKKGFDEVNKRMETSKKHLSALNILGPRFASVIDEIKAKLKALGETETGGKIFKNFAKTLGGTFKSLQTNLAFTWRFIKYRIMNAITRAISTAFSEGIKSVYEWASITGNEFVGTMDRITTSVFYAKNAFGALGANILTALEPVIVSLCDWLVKAVDLVSMFVAKITGQNYYLSVATKTFKSYEDAINGANKALGTLAGFDEINNIGSSSSSGNGSTTGIDENTFKKIDLEDAFDGKTWLESLALTIKDVFFDLSELNGEQIAEKAVTGLFGLIGLSLGGLKGAILGVGLSLVLNSVIFNHNGILESGEIKNTIASILISIAGALFGASVLTPIFGSAGTVVGFGIGIGLSLLFSWSNTKVEKLQNDNNLPKFNNNFTDDFYVTGKNLGTTLNQGINDGIKESGTEQARQEMINKYGGIVDSVRNDIRPNYKALGQVMTDEIKAGTDYDSVGQELSNGINNSYNTVIWQAKDNGYSIGSTTSQNIANGIKDGMTEIEKGMMSVNGVMIGSRPVVDTSAGNIANDVKNRFEDMNVNSVRSAENMVGDVGKKWNNLNTDTKKKMDDIYRYNSMFNANVYKGTSSMANNLSINWGKLWSGMKTSFKSGANAILSNLERWINNFIGGINDLSSGLRSLGNDVLNFFGINYRFGEIGRISLPRLATGTNYVPEDTLAMLHQGEAVVPKKFNSEEFFNGSSEETNDLIRELIQVVREKKTTISKKDVGEASIDYIRSQTRLKGASVI